MRICELFAQSVARNPNKIALITEKNQLTYNDLQGLAEIFERRFKGFGGKVGDKVLLNSDRSEFVLSMALASSRLSLTTIFADYAKAIAGSVEFDWVVSGTVVDGWPVEKQIIMAPEWFADLGAVPLSDYAVFEGDGCAFVTTTSGSTGTPKFVHSDESSRISRSNDAGHRAWQTSTTRYLTTMSNIQSWTIMSMLRTLIAGGSIVSLTDHRNRYLPYLDLYRVTHFFATPAVIRSILDTPKAQQFLASLEYVQIGGAYCGPEMLAEFAAIFPGVLEAGYGASEIGGLCEATYDRTGKTAPGYLGELRRKDLELVFFDDDLNIMPDANEGIVGIRKREGPNDRKYVSKSTGDDKTGFVKGYFVPGDILRRDGDSLYFIGRVKNILNRSGNKYSLDRLQSVLEAAVPGARFGCVSKNGEDGLEELVVYYVCKEEISLRDVNWALASETGNLQTRYVIRLPEMPLTSSGKVASDALRKMLAKKIAV